MRFISEPFMNEDKIKWINELGIENITTDYKEFKIVFDNFFSILVNSLIIIFCFSKASYISSGSFLLFLNFINSKLLINI